MGYARSRRLLPRCVECKISRTLLLYLPDIDAEELIDSIFRKFFGIAFIPDNDGLLALPIHIHPDEGHLFDLSEHEVKFESAPIGISHRHKPLSHGSLRCPASAIHNHT